MEARKKLTIPIDLKLNSMIPLPQFIQNDTNILEFTVKDNGIDADLSNITRIVVNYKRLDKKVISRLLTATGNTILYEIGLEEMEVPGPGEMELQFFENEDRISTKRFKVNMLASIGTDAIYENTDQLTVLQELFVEVDTVKAETETARQNADAATEAANTAAVNAQQVADENKTNWLSPVNAFADIATTYPSPANGDQVQTISDGKEYRFNQNVWEQIRGFSSSAIADLQVKHDQVVEDLADIATVYASKFKTDSNDWGQAINSALNSISAGTVILPKGDLTYSNSIVMKSNIRIKGQGIHGTTLKPVGCHGVTTALDAYLRFAAIEDLTISGDNNGDLSIYNSNKNGINWNSGNKETYQCTIRNVRIEKMQGRGIYAPFDFNNLFENVSVSKCAGHGIEINGYISDTLINCHIDYVGNGKAAYRIYARAHLMSCNGMGGNGEYWGIFGRRNNLFVDTTGNEVSQYYIVFENCNVEDFTKVGLKFIFAGGFELRNTDFMAPPTGTFDCYIDAEQIDKLSTIDGLTRFESKGSTMTYSQRIRSNLSQAYLISYNPSVDGFSVDGVNKVKIPVFSTKYEYLNNTFSISHINIENMTYYYLGGKKHTHGTASPTTGTWSVGDRVHNNSPTSGGYAGWICTRSGKAHMDSVADRTVGTNTLTNVTNISTWTVGDVIQGYAIPAGTTVTAVNTSTNTLTISQNATATGGAVSISDAVFKGFGAIQT